MKNNSDQFFTRQRLAWLERYAQAHGTIRRKHITEMFGVCMAHVSGDIAEYLRLNPGSLIYDLNQKHYAWNPKKKLVITPAPWEPMLEALKP